MQLSPLTNTAADVRSSLYHLRALRHIRPLLSDADAQLLSCSFVQSRLDYCNSLLTHTSVFNLKRLQRLQNSLARLTFRTEPTLSSNALLAKHHWLPVSSRINYKVANITHTVLSTKQPSYLSERLTPYIPSRSLRSSHSSQLTTPWTHLQLINQLFSVASPIIWNSLPQQIRCTPSHTHFCKQLKTELYRSAFAS